MPGTAEGGGLGGRGGSFGYSRSGQLIQQFWNWELLAMSRYRVNLSIFAENVE
jgi:hypothetical protein